MKRKSYEDKENSSLQNWHYFFCAFQSNRGKHEASAKSKSHTSEVTFLRSFPCAWLTPHVRLVRLHSPEKPKIWARSAG